MAEDEAEKELHKRMKRSPFSRWTQFNNEHTKELMWLALKFPKAHAIFIFSLIRWMNITLLCAHIKSFKKFLALAELQPAALFEF